MEQMKLIEKILTNKEYCEKIAAMSCETFAQELATHGIELPNIEKCTTPSRLPSPLVNCRMMNSTSFPAALACASARARFAENHSCEMTTG